MFEADGVGAPGDADGRRAGGAARHPPRFGSGAALDAHAAARLASCGRKTMLYVGAQSALTWGSREVGGQDLSVRAFVTLEV